VRSILPIEPGERADIAEHVVADVRFLDDVQDVAESRGVHTNPTRHDVFDKPDVVMSGAIEGVIHQIGDALCGEEPRSSVVLASAEV